MTDAGSTSGQALFDLLEVDDRGLVPVILQDNTSHKVLSLVWMNREALEKTVEAKLVHVYCPDQGVVALKGKKSGHKQTVMRIYIDCEQKSLLLRVTPRIGSCHRGYLSCYHRAWDDKAGAFNYVEDRTFDPAVVYDD